MSDETINKLKLIQHNIESLNYNVVKPNIICVSKTFSIQKLKPLIDFGHCHFGENKVQEAVGKWSQIKEEHKDLKIHMVGKLQTNKVKKAVRLFDFIHSLDNIKLADALKKSESEFNKKISYFIQINIGNENQKSGIYAKDAKDFLKYCVKEAKLNIIGLMVIPPNDENTARYFQDISNLNSELGLKNLSMGMSSDYELAIKFKATFLRIGSGILGPRNIK
tara:strand:- start:2225 stop:2887 length:663 start_codon:yes stop_codon:yes gene_type:complete